MKTSLSRALPAAALVAATLVAASPASAATTIDCSRGPVTVKGSDEAYRLVGACSKVTVRGSGLRVTLTSATAVTLHGSDTVITAAKPGKVKLIGSGNKLTAGRGASLMIRGSGTVARFTKVPTVVVRGADNRVVVERGRTSVEVVGAGNVIRVSEPR